MCNNYTRNEKLINVVQLHSERDGGTVKFETTTLGTGWGAVECGTITPGTFEQGGAITRGAAAAR